MKLKKREQWIAIILLLVLATPRLGASFSQFLWGESRRLERALEASEASLDQFRQKLLQAEDAQRLVDQVVPQCLPADASRAFAMYQKWLYESADRSGMTQTMVSPEPSETSAAGLQLVRAKLRSTGPMPAVVRFMQAVHERQPLQRVLECRLTPVHQKANTIFEVSLLLEMLGSKDSELQEVPLPANLERDRAPAETQQIADLTTMFEPYAPPPPPRPKSSPRRVVAKIPKPLKKQKAARPVRPPVALIGTIIRGHHAEAVFYNRQSRQASYLTKGKRLRYASGFDAEILGIERDCVLLKINKSSSNARIVKMRLAQLLTDLD